MKRMFSSFLKSAIMVYILIFSIINIFLINILYSKTLYNDYSIKASTFCTQITSNINIRLSAFDDMIRSFCKKTGFEKMNVNELISYSKEIKNLQDILPDIIDIIVTDGSKNIFFTSTNSIEQMAKFLTNDKLSEIAQTNQPVWVYFKDNQTAKNMLLYVIRVSDTSPYFFVFNISTNIISLSHIESKSNDIFYKYMDVNVNFKLGDSLSLINNNENSAEIKADFLNNYNTIKENKICINTVLDNKLISIYTTVNFGYFHHRLIFNVLLSIAIALVFMPLIYILLKKLGNSISDSYNLLNDKMNLFIKKLEGK